MIRQRVITCREGKAYDGSDNEKRKDDVVLDGKIRRTLREGVAR